MSLKEGEGKVDGSRKPLLAIAAIVVVVIIVAAVLVVVMLPSGNNPNSEANINTSVSDMIIKPADLPAGWTIASPFYPGYQGTLPGNYSEAGGIGLNLTE